MSNDTNAATGRQATTPALLVAIFSLGSVCALSLAVAYFFKRHTWTLSCASTAIGLILAATALGIARPERIRRLERLRVARLPLLLLFAWLGWGGFIGFIAWIQSGNSWDECVFMLGGMSLRGYSTEYAVHRPPITQFLCAVFVDQPALINPTLLILLLALLTCWGAKRWGLAGSGLLLLLLLGQNVFVASCVDVLSELPASILICLAFYCLSREWLFVSGLSFGLACLARWNIALLPAALTVLVWARFGRKGTALYVLGGAVVGGLFALANLALVESPYQTILTGNLAPAFAWAADGAERPDFLARLQFYVPSFFFFTPLGLLAVFWGLVGRDGLAGRNRRESSSEDWCVRSAVPFGVAAYAISMTGIGGLFERFMAPMIPLVMLVLLDFAIVYSRALLPGDRARVRALAAVSSVTIAWGLWPCSFLFFVRDNLQHQAVFTKTFIQASKSLPAPAILHCPPLDEISANSGFPAMVEVRRTIVFPGAVRTEVGNIIPARDGASAVWNTCDMVPPGALVVIPKGLGPEDERTEKIAGDARWELHRKRVGSSLTRMR